MGWPNTACCRFCHCRPASASKPRKTSAGGTFSARIKENEGDIRTVRVFTSFCSAAVLNLTKKLAKSLAWEEAPDAANRTIKGITAHVCAVFIASPLLASVGFILRLDLPINDGSCRGRERGTTFGLTGRLK